MWERGTLLCKSTTRLAWFIHMLFMLSSRRRRVSSYNKESRLNVKRFEFIAGEIICEIKARHGGWLFKENAFVSTQLPVSNLIKSSPNWGVDLQLSVGDLIYLPSSHLVNFFKKRDPISLKGFGLSRNTVLIIWNVAPWTLRYNFGG